MFYCEPCGHHQGWPTDIFVPRSRGKCEMCDALAVCFDVPSSRLGAPEPDPRAEVIPGEADAIESIKAVLTNPPPKEDA